MTKQARWSERHARPSGCAWVLLAGTASLLTGLWPAIHAIT